MNCNSDMHLDVEHITYIVVYLDNPLYLGRYLYACGARRAECGECGVRSAESRVRSAEYVQQQSAILPLLRSR